MADQIKTLLFTGGEIHDWKGCGDEIERVLKADGRFDLTRVNEDLDCLIAPKLDPYDLIVVMDKENRRILANMAQDQDQLNKIHMLREFDPLGDGNQDVPDPYYGGLEGFEETFQIVKRSCEGLLEALESGRFTP